MKRVIEIKNTELLNYGSELTDKIQSYIANTQMIINCGKASTRLFKMSDSICIIIHHTEKSIIVEKLN